MRRLAIIAALALSACATTPPANPQDAFWANLSAHCGRAFPGKLASDEAADAGFKGRPLIMHVRSCTDSEIRIPFHVGPKDADGKFYSSRTGVISPTATGLRRRPHHRPDDRSRDTQPHSCWR